MIVIFDYVMFSGVMMVSVMYVGLVVCEICGWEGVFIGVDVREEILLIVKLG